MSKSPDPVLAGLFDTDGGLRLKVSGDDWFRIHITPQGLVRVGDGTAPPQPQPAVGGALGFRAYRAPSAENKITSSTSLVEVDAANLAVSFTAPSSGAVEVVVEASARSDVAGSVYHWGLLEGAAVVADRHLVTQNTAHAHTSVRFFVTGLTPGSTHTYKWAHCVSSNTGRMTTGLETSTIDFGAASMGVRAL